MNCLSNVHYNRAYFTAQYMYTYLQMSNSYVWWATTNFTSCFIKTQKENSRLDYSLTKQKKPLKIRLSFPAECFIKNQKLLLTGIKPLNWFIKKMRQSVSIWWQNWSLTHFVPLVSFCTPWKHQKTTDVFKGYRMRPVAWNEFMC